MPSPIGHALAGLAISLAGPARRAAVTGKESIDWRLAGLCALMAAAPDIDLLYLPIHRTVTHSLPMAALVTIVASVVTGKVNLTRRQEGSPSCLFAFSPLCLSGLLIGLAWSSHVLLDWLGADANPPYGIQMFWPFSDRWYFSAWNVFPGTERRNPFGSRALLINLRAALVELGIMGSIATSVWALRTAWTTSRTSKL